VKRGPVLVHVTASLAACSSHPPEARSLPPGFDKARAAFRDHVAGVLHVPSRDVEVGPIDEEIERHMTDHLVGRAWALEASGSSSQFSLRGWALPDGTVVTDQHNLGVLFDEAGAWTSAPRLDANELAKRLVWALGFRYELVGAPSLELASSGVGAMHFDVREYLSGNPPPPDLQLRCTVTLSANHQAELHMEPVPAP
jgi:hypothetical protein